MIEMPALEIGPPSSWKDLDRAIAHLQDFDWLILTSTNGVDYFFERLATYSQDLSALANVKIAVVGKKTAARLREQGREPDFIPPDFVADALVQHFPERDRLSALHILFPRVETGGREVLVKELTAQGATVVEVAAYQSGCVGAIAPEVLNALKQGQIDVVTFASSKTVQCFGQLLEAGLGTAAEQRTQLLESVCIASIGPQTSSACQTYLGRVDLEAQEYTLEGLTQAIVQWAGANQSV